MFLMVTQHPPRKKKETLQRQEAPEQQSAHHELELIDTVVPLQCHVTRASDAGTS